MYSQASDSPLHSWCLKSSEGSTLSPSILSVAHETPGQKALASPSRFWLLLFLAFAWILLCYIWINCKSPLITHSVETDNLLPRVWLPNPRGVPVYNAASYSILSITHSHWAANSLSKNLFFSFWFFNNRLLTKPLSFGKKPKTAFPVIYMNTSGSGEGKRGNSFAHYSWGSGSLGG